MLNEDVQLLFRQKVQPIHYDSPLYHIIIM